MPFSRPDLTEGEFLQLNAQERQALADEYSALSAEERMPVPFKVRAKMLAQLMTQNLNENVRRDRLTS